jgi:hypothetical protein
MPVHTLTADMVAAAKHRKRAAVPAEAAAADAKAAKAQAEAAKARGNAAFGAGRFDDALAAYCEALELDSENGLLWGARRPWRRL